MLRLPPAPALAILTGVLASVLRAQAPAGFRTAVDEVTGLEYHAPKDYTEIPVSPTEQALRGRFRRIQVPDELTEDRSKPKPEIQVFCFKKAAGGTTPDDDGAGAAPPDAGPKTVREAMEKAGAIGSFDQFKKKKLAGWKVEPVSGRESHFLLEPEPSGRTIWTGYLVVRDEGPWVAGVCGFTLRPHLPKMKATVAAMAQSLKLGALREPSAAGAAAASDAIDRLYPAGKFRAVEHRKSVRLGMAQGWKALDTDNYILVHHSADERLINKIARDIEAMRAHYQSLFPAVKETDKVSIVRICRNREEYLAYGGPPTAGGHWHPGNEELVFYDYDQTTLDNERAGVSGRKTTDKDSLLVLYHEAFHQYIHYAVGEIAPHDWFNEGHGDYFSGAVIPQYGTKVDRIGPSSWRIHRAKDQCEHGKGFVALKDLVTAERQQYYNPARISDFYAAGWSFVYFLRQSEKVKAHPRWSRLLEDYFDTMKKAFAEEMELKGASATLAEKQAVQQSARGRALKAFMEDLDLATLEAEWKSFVVKMKDPWPERRKKS